MARTHALAFCLKPQIQFQIIEHPRFPEAIIDLPEITRRTDRDHSFDHRVRRPFNETERRTQRKSHESDRRVAFFLNISDNSLKILTFFCCPGEQARTLPMPAKIKSNHIIMKRQRFCDLPEKIRVFGIKETVRQDNDFCPALAVMRGYNTLTVFCL